MLNKWLQAEKKVFEGWDFTEIDKYSESDPLPWSYFNMAKPYIRENKIILDMGTGGGEFLLSLVPFPGKTFATEMYRPNYDYAKDTMAKHGISLSFVSSENQLPYGDDMFDVILNRHESYDPNEVFRILKPGGVFLTQQVGGLNSLDLSTWLLNGKQEGDDTWSMVKAKSALEKVGFKVTYSEESFPKLRFFDVATFVHFAKIIEWEFPGFSVSKHYEKLEALQERLDEVGYFELTEHRFLLKCEK